MCLKYTPALILTYADSGNAAGAPDTEQKLSALVEEIQNRRCPPMKRFKNGSSFAVKVKGSLLPSADI